MTLFCRSHSRWCAGSRAAFRKCSTWRRASSCACRICSAWNWSSGCSGSTVTTDIMAGRPGVQYVGMTDHHSVWRELIAGPDLTASFRRHLAFLTDSPESEAMLSDLLDRLVSARIDGDTLELAFRYAEYDDETCVVGFGPPYPGGTGGGPPPWG